LDGQHFIFHKGLNCIIGGKGVGKSVLIELLRFALEQTSDQEAIQKDTEGKLKDQLGKESSVTVRVVTRTGRALDVKRVYDGQDNPTQVRDVDTTNTINVKINDLFPILAYSQTEALEIARDNHAQLRLIDLFIDMASFKSDAKALRLEISKMDNQLIDALKAKEQLSEVRGNLCTLKEKKREVDDALTSDVKSRYNEAKKIDDRVAELLDYISNIKDDLTGYVDELKERQIDISVTDDDADIIQAITDLVGDVKDSTLKGLAGLVGKIDTLQKNAKLKNEEWTEEFEDIEDQYSEWVTQQGADAEALSEERERIGNEIKKLETRIESLEKEANSAEEITANRSKKLDELHDLRDELYHCRKEKYDQITEASDGRLQLDLEKEGIDEPFLEALGRILYGSNIRANDKEGIVNTTTPRDFVERIIQDDDDYFVEHVQMSERACENLFSHFEEVEDLKTLLPLQYRPLLEDKPLIQFKKSNGQYYPLEKISIGQKCTCLLIIALAEGSRPVLIDQPEDALDIRSVYTDITMQLRDRKVARQFILTTHNPTVAVTSDSDQFHVMKADATKGRCSHSGAIEVKTVRDEVIQHLEGGEESYILKNRKYNVNR
jgi:ABC-type cobalamin/Fe3+-siderophores transport system ATPase subunit